MHTCESVFFPGIVENAADKGLLQAARAELTVRIIFSLF
jgi:hypothetical protein